MKLLLLYSLLVCAMLAQSKPLLLYTDDAPPHIIRSNNTGIDIDITTEILKEMGLQVNIAYAPLARSLKQVELKQADITVPTFFQQDSDNLFFSDAIIMYRPTIFTLNPALAKLSSLKDIKGLNVFSFQGATGYFGEQYIAMTKQNHYFEHHDMAALPSFLVQQKADVIILDYYIFYYFLRYHHSQFNKTEINSHSLIPAVSAHVGFNDVLLRDAFNEVLKHFKLQGKDQQIIHQYIGQP